MKIILLLQYYSESAKGKLGDPSLKYATSLWDDKHMQV